MVVARINDIGVKINEDSRKIVVAYVCLNTADIVSYGLKTTYIRYRGLKTTDIV